MNTLLKLIQTFVFLVSIASGRIFEDNASKYEGAQLFKVEKVAFITKLLSKKRVDVWSANATFYDVLVKKDKVDEVKSLLYSNGMRYTVVNKNVAKIIRKNNLHSNRTSMRTLTDSYIPTFDCYQTLEEIHGYLDYLAEKYPQIASVGIMGYTGEGKPLKFIKISSEKNNAKAFFIDGGIHAREWASPAAVTFIIKQLVERRTRLPHSLLNLDFYILPLFNPDGYEYSYTEDRLWRKNRSKNGECYGADINRNFDVEFGGKGTSSDPCDETYRGERANSELETQAFVKFLGNIGKSLAAYVTFHSYGQYILIPFGHDVGHLPNDFNDLKRVGNRAALAIARVGNTKYQVGNTATLLYPAAGGSDDWVKTFTSAKYVYTIELRDEGEFGFVLPETLILPTAIEAFEAIKVIADAAYRTHIGKN